MRALLLVVLSGCILGSKVAPLELRYFAPVEAVSESTTAAPEVAIRLSRVTAQSHLRYRIGHRESAVELQFYEALRWTERPDEYVRRALLHALGDRGIQLIVGGEAPRLEVEVAAFEEVRRGKRSFGRVRLRYRLDDERCVIASDVITVEREAASQDISDIVVAIGDAMTAASAELATRVPIAIRAHAPRSAP